MLYIGLSIIVLIGGQVRSVYLTMDFEPAHDNNFQFYN